MGVALFLVAIKLFGYFVTGSVALLGSLLDSVLDVAASSLNLVAIRHAAIPADREHRFGHGKAEAVAGLAQSMLIGGSAAFLTFEAIARLIKPAPVTSSTLGVIILSSRSRRRSGSSSSSAASSRARARSPSRRIRSTTRATSS